jgi:hypothetical protein
MTVRWTDAGGTVGGWDRWAGGTPALTAHGRFVGLATDLVITHPSGVEHRRVT